MNTVSFDLGMQHEIDVRTLLILQDHTLHTV